MQCVHPPSRAHRNPLRWFAAALVLATTSLGASEADGVKSTLEDDDGWPDMSGFLERKYGFLPVVLPITEPAVGYGAAAGLAFISKPLAGEEAGFGRPNITMVGGFGTDNGTWGTAVADVRHWLDDRVQTIVGGMYSSVNLDFHGVGRDRTLDDDPLGYNLEPKGGMLQGKYRLGASRAWVGLNYAFASTHVSFDSPEDRERAPEFENDSNVGGLTPSLSYDTRDNIFTPNSGSYVELSAGLFSSVLGGDDEFQRLRLIAMHYVPLHSRLTLGLRLDAAASFGNVPFYLRPFLYMRGLPAMRYQGEETALAEAELRWQFWKRFSLVGFVGVGGTWNDLERFDDSQAVVAGGPGLRYEIARKYGIHMGADVAFGPETTAVYIQVGSAWARP